MNEYLFKVFKKSDAHFTLRFLGSDGHLIGQRELDTADIERFIEEVERHYRAGHRRLPALGAQLYEWLDGPTERWLEGALKDAPGLAIHIDVSERLRHLPWELVARQGIPLCANPHRPFTPVYRVSDERRSFDCANRPLRVLFMACSPEKVEPVLDFEGEERAILEATRRPPVELVVEESGSLAGLKERVEAFGPVYFDVFHLTGHADVKDGRPCFIMEDELGLKHEATPDEIARAFSGNWPRLVFLSGCQTGQSVDQGSLPSLAEALVRAGAPAVLCARQSRGKGMIDNYVEAMELVRKMEAQLPIPARPTATFIRLVAQ